VTCTSQCKHSTFSEKPKELLTLKDGNGHTLAIIKLNNKNIFVANYHPCESVPVMTQFLVPTVNNGTYDLIAQKFTGHRNGAYLDW